MQRDEDSWGGFLREADSAQRFGERKEGHLGEELSHKEKEVQRPRGRSVLRSRNTRRPGVTGAPQTRMRVTCDGEAGPTCRILRVLLRIQVCLFFIVLFVAVVLFLFVWATPSAACGILVPRSEIEPKSPTGTHGILTTGPPGKVRGSRFHTDVAESHRTVTERATRLD